MSKMFRITLAGLLIEVCPVYDYVSEYCADYRSADMKTIPDIAVVIHQEDIDREAAQADPIYREKGIRPFPEVLEVTAVYRKIAEAMLMYGTLTMHGVIVATAGQGYMITAPSGVGKTTRGRLWCEHIPGSEIVNGDKPLIQLKDEGTFACGTPWCGKERINSNKIVPLRAILLLERMDGKNALVRPNAADAYLYLMRQTYLPADAALRRRGLDLLKSLTERVPVYRFLSEPTAASVRMAWETLRASETV